jgi:hypothetical protein
VNGGIRPETAHSNHHLSSKSKESTNQWAISVYAQRRR